MSYSRIYSRMGCMTYVIFPDGGVCVGVCGEKKYARPGLFNPYKTLETTRWKDDIFDLYADNHDDVILGCMERDMRNEIIAARVDKLFQLVKSKLIIRY